MTPLDRCVCVLTLPLDRLIIIKCKACLLLQDDFLLRHYDSGECQGKLGHSRLSVILHRAQVGRRETRKEFQFDKFQSMINFLSAGHRNICWLRNTVTGGLSSPLSCSSLSYLL